MGKTPDVAQLSTCCGKPLVWDLRRCEEPDCGCSSWDATCPMCGCQNADGMPSAERHLTPVEELLLARIATLEDALRWRVTAAEMPPGGVDVWGWWRGDARPYEMVRRVDGLWWLHGGDWVAAPHRWLPFSGVPHE